MRQLAILPILTLVLAACFASDVPADDIDIARQLSNRLRVAKAEGNLKGFRINVKVEDSVVWLSGNVPNDSQQQIALLNAQEIPGVRLVVNNITVGDVAPLADTGISELDDSAVPPIVSGRQLEEALITAPKLTATNPRSSSLVDRAVASTTQTVGPATVHASGLSYPASEPAMPPTRSESTPPYMLLPNVGYVGLVPSNVHAGQPQQVPTVVSVVPAIVPVPAPHASGPRPVPIAAARPARLVNYQCDAGGCYGGGSPMGIPVSECPSGFCPSGPGYGGGFDGGMQSAEWAQFGSGYGTGISGSRYENPQMPPYAWPSYAAHPNYAAVTYPRQYSPMAWPYIGPFYPYPQVPLGWRKVCLEWDDGWWMLDFKAKAK